ncbi:Light-sensor Protein kinase [Trapelia coarctata]|nr:Light-sensor Protein kinase [Trapelia coarctata]
MYPGPADSNCSSPTHDQGSSTHRRTKSEHSRSPSSSGAHLSNLGHPLLPTARYTIPTDLPAAASVPSDSVPQSPGAQDRVFPVRSVVSVDPNPTPLPTPQVRPEVRGDGFFAPDPLPKRRTGSRRQSNASVHSVDQQSEASTASTPLKLSRINTGTTRKDSAIIRDNQSVDEANKWSASAQSDTDGASGFGRVQILSENASSKSGGDAKAYKGIASKSDEASIRSTTESGGLVTARFTHVMTDGEHAVITGRDGETLQRCEDEPIHIPGAVQGFGLLIALSENIDGKLVVRVASENSRRIIGYSPRDLFKLENFCDILSDEQADNLLDHLDFIRDDNADPATNGPEVFTLAIRSPSRKILKLWCAMHINDSNPDMIICEFELEDDQECPLVPMDSKTPESPEDTLHGCPTEEELAESTVNMSKPLRVLRSARKRKGEAAAMEVFNIMSQVQEQLASAPTLEKFLKVLVGVVKELTGFHRVMIYQFDHTWNGKVVTELVDPRATKDLYKGLNFPASDIPKQARDLYKINKVRLLYDRDQETARLVCRTLEDLETPLDLTYAYLRAMSPIHIKYLANMAVRASMSISINAFDELWGLIACHAYGPKGMRVSFPIRKMCRLVGDSASRNIERLSYASRLQARKLINTVPTASNPSGYIIASSDDLLKLFDADYGLLSIRDETKILGRLEQTQEALALLEYLRLRQITSVISSQDIRADFLDLRYPPGFTIIAGLLFVPLSVGGNDFIVFFRKGQARQVKWAGNPYEKFVQEGTEGYLEPRKSFRTWSETVVGKCKEWTEEQVETAAVLCLVYGKFIQVWREKEAALQNSQLTRLLLSNSAHEVRTPLNAIINYLEIALEGSLDAETRENLSKSHSASKSLIYVINDLLDLTKTEEGKDLIKGEVFDLPATVREAADMFTGDAKRKQIEFLIAESPGIPQFVIGDQRRIRQAISNITANAIQHTEKGCVKVDLWLAESGERHIEVDIAVQDTGAGMSAKKLDALFRELEQVQSESEDLLQEKLGPDSKVLTTGIPGKRTLGLGLAVVARIIRNMNGQLRLKSEEGKGSRFVMQLGFDLPSQDDRKAVTVEAKEAEITSLSALPSTPPVEAGEVYLVNKSGQRAAERQRGGTSRRNSRDSMRSTKSAKSLKSFRSGSSAKSNVDRLIDAMQDTHMVPTPKNAESQHSRSADWTDQHTHLSPKLGRPGSSRSLASSGLAPELSEVIQVRSDGIPGQVSVVDSRTPIKPVRMSGGTGASTTSPEPTPQGANRVLFEIPDTPVDWISPPMADHLHVLVAEDDPVNSKIIKKRLEKYGHDVYLTINGEECANAYGEKATFFDVVLMDMQMPIVDGLTSTKMIRAYEKTHPNETLSNRAALNGRVPVFAVSASLIEKNLQLYIDAGFDGWILKPIDFKRLAVLLSGIVEEHTRKSCLYKPGEWEKGGWFTKLQPSAFASSTRPLRQASVSSTKVKSHHDQEEGRLGDPISQDQDRLDRLTADAVNAPSLPEDPGASQG